MKCMLCGTDNREQASHCKGCGSSLSTGSQRSPLRPPPTPTVLETPMTFPEPDEPLGAMPASSPRKTTPTPPSVPVLKHSDAGAPANLAAMEIPAPGTPTPGPRPGTQGATEVDPSPPIQPPTAPLADKRTRYVPPSASRSTGGGGAARDAASHGATRLVGFAVSYSHNPSGEWFAIREGKNVFGTSPTCECVVRQDPSISATHFAVHCRGDQVLVKDLVSTNATAVDDQEIWGDHAPARHGSVIRAGASVFQLVLVPPLEAGD